MKALHILDHSIPLHSGYTFRTRSILKEQHALGIETCHVTSEKQGNIKAGEEVVDGLKFYRTKPANGIMSKLPAVNQLALITPLRDRILEIIEVEKPDVLHAHSPALNGIAAMQAAQITGLPLVYEIRAFWEDAAVDHGTCKEGDLRYRLTRALESYVVKRANAVTTICEGLKKDLLERGTPENKITVIPNAVNINQFSRITEKNSELLTELSLSDKKVLGFIGSFYAYEGLDLTIEALPHILKNHPDTMLLLVGGGPQENNLRAQVKALGLEKHVLFTGRVPHSEVERYYSVIDLLVYPRKSMRLTELVTPLKPLEAMAQGKAFIASDVGGHHELITDNETGFLFRADDVEHLSQRISELFASPENLNQTLEGGLDYVANVRNWQTSVSNYLPLYAKLTESVALK